MYFKKNYVMPIVALVFSLTLVSCSIFQSGESVIDCPLRDEPYSVDTPMMDLMLNPSAVIVLENEMPELMKRVPPLFKSSEAPSLSAIMTVREVMALMRMPANAVALQQLNTQLAAVELTEADKMSRCARYDNDTPEIVLNSAKKQILIFNKVNGYDHGEGTVAATEAIKTIAAQQGWGVSITNKGGAFTADTLKQFDLVVWNNVSGDVLTIRQRKAFENYITNGGGFLGVHGSGGDFIYLWDWYVESLIGAQFIGHTMSPHYQNATVKIEQSSSHIGDGLKAEWVLHDEWYSFSSNPRNKGADVVATIDESSYKAEMSGISLRMGSDHPIAWSRCVGAGRSFYTAIGHLPEVYQDEQNMALLKNALIWTVGESKSQCGK